MIAEGNGPDRPYIQKASLDGQPWTRSTLPHEAIINGGELIFTMGASPQMEWGAAPGNRPRTRVDGPRMLAVPFFESGAPTFGDSMTVAIGTSDLDVDLYYRIGDGPTIRYEQPIELTTTAEVEAWAAHADGRESKSTRATWYKVDQGRSIDLKMTYANPYSAGGDRALIDHLRGTGNFQTGRWQGYQAQDFEAIVDLGKIQQADSVGVGFLQDVKSWIWLPPEVKFEASTDGEAWTQLGKSGHDVPEDLYGSHIRDFRVAVGGPIRYLRVTAPNFGTCPDWHMGAGGDSWLFADEIWIR